MCAGCPDCTKFETARRSDEWFLRYAKEKTERQMDRQRFLALEINYTQEMGILKKKKKKSKEKISSSQLFWFRVIAFEVLKAAVNHKGVLTLYVFPYRSQCDVLTLWRMPTMSSLSALVGEQLTSLKVLSDSGGDCLT